MATLEDRILALEQEVAALRRIVNGVPLEPTTKRRAAALPGDWQPRPQDIELGRMKFPNVDIAHETDSFRDYWASRGTPLKDWDAAFRNWLRKSAQYSKPETARLRPQGRAAAIGQANDQRVEGALARLSQVGKASRS